jgi:hypothetical protein
VAPVTVGPVADLRANLTLSRVLSNPS